MRSALLFALLGFAPAVALAQLPPLSELRVCGVPARDADGSIHRSTAVIKAFRKAHPCPATRKTAGACPGWAIDHVIPLASCGCDAVSNMQWLPDALKNAGGLAPKDRWERAVYTCPEVTK